MHAFRIFHKIGILEIHKAVVSEVIHLLPFDQTIAGIGEDQSHNGCPLSEGCLILLAIHHESAVSGDRQYLFLRVDQLGCHSPGTAMPMVAKPLEMMQVLGS